MNPETTGWYSEKGVADDARELHRIWQKAGAKMQAPRATWISRAQYDRQGEPRPNLYNAMLALRSDARVLDLFSYDEMLRAPILSRLVPGQTIVGENEPFRQRPVRDPDVAALQELLQASGLERSVRIRSTRPSICVPTNGDFMRFAITWMVSDGMARRA